MRGRTVRRRALALAVAIGVTGCAPDRITDLGAPTQVDAKLSDATQADLEKAVTDAMAATGSSGAIVGVWVPWSGSWVTGLGTQSPTDDSPVAADMDFRVGDVSRAMVCDALYKAAADNLLALDDSVTKYVSGVPNLKDVTLLELCNGTAGIGSYQGQLQNMWMGNPQRVWDPRELAAFGLGLGTAGTPGSAYRDSDAGYVLLGLALQRVTGKSAADVLEEDVFSPLGLEATRLPEGRGQWAAGSKSLQGGVSLKDANGAFTCSEPVDMTSVSTSTGFTDSGVVSTITDLGRYTQALATGALGRGAEVWKGRWANPLPPSANAAQWFTATGGAYQAGSLIGQYGAVPGYMTAAFADPETGLTVAVVLNNSAAGSGLAAYLAWELAAIASKAPAADGQKAPQFGLPWTAEQFHAAIQSAAICPTP